MIMTSSSTNHQEVVEGLDGFHSNLQIKYNSILSRYPNQHLDKKIEDKLPT